MKKTPTRHDDWMLRRINRDNKNKNFKCIYNSQYDLINLTDLYKDQTLFLCCGGPSATPDILSEIRSIPGVVVMGINNIVDKIKPDIWIGVDEPTRFLEKAWLDPSIQKFYPLSYSGTNIKQELKPNQCPNTFLLYRNDNFNPKTFFTEDTICWGYEPQKGEAGGHSTMLAAMRLIHILGFKEIYLAGADFNMSTDNAYGHGQKTVSSTHARKNNVLYRFLIKCFDQLDWKSVGMNIFNLNPNSALKTFEFKDLKEVSVKLKSKWEIINQKTSEGLYDKHYKGKELPPPKLKRLYLTQKTPNIGDDIQTLACIAKHEGTLDIDFNELNLINRDYPKDLSEEYKLDINCWYALNDKAEGFADNIKCEISSIHLKWQPDQIPIKVKEWLKNNQPIGCRDRWSQWACEQLSLEAYLAPCPTLRLRKEHLGEINNEKIDLVLVDVKIKNIPDKMEIIREFSHNIDGWKTIDPVDRLNMALEKLRIYSQAKAVISNRIHVCFPCWGIGTPAYLINDNRDTSRFGGYEALIKYKNQSFVDKFGFEPLSQR